MEYDRRPDYVALQRLYDQLSDKSSECAERLARVLEGSGRSPAAQEAAGGVITHGRHTRRSEAHSDDELNYTE